MEEQKLAQTLVQVADTGTEPKLTSLFLSEAIATQNYDYYRKKAEADFLSGDFDALLATTEQMIKLAPTRFEVFILLFSLSLLLSAKALW